MSKSPMPLAGIKVVEIAQNIAGPFAGEILASLGADVLKIERPDGDDARGWGPPFRDGSALTFLTVNRNKRGITLDLKDPAGRDWLLDHLETCDVLVQNLRPGALDSLGLGAEALLERFPRLVYCSLWAFGHTGPMHRQGGYEPMIQAYAGMFSQNGMEGGPPTRVGMQVLDLGSGVWAALGVIAALLRRTETGRGGRVDTSLFETALGWLTAHWANFQATGTPPPRHRSGNPKVVVFQAFDTADGEVVVAAANDRLFAKYAAELGHPEWSADPRFKTNGDRVAHKPDLLPQIEAVMRQHTTAEWLERLERIGVPCAPVNDLHDVEALPQTEALGIVQPVPDHDWSSIALPVSFDGERPPITRRAPRLGEHNDEVFGPAQTKPMPVAAK